jgi:CheY-like chemotaxis protein
VNLLTNAVKYTEDGGRIGLLVERDHEHVAVRVRDTGIGIAPATLAKIFELFVQGPGRAGQAPGGLGIGLSLARTLVEKHGGNLTAQSRGTGQGSEFVCRLPMLPAEHSVTPRAGVPVREQVPASASLEPSADAGRHRILIVDDNRVAADGLGRLLAQVYRQDVRVAYDGPSALQLAAAFQPELILLDLGMAVMDGYEVARRLRQDPITTRARIVALTGWGQEEDRRRSRETGFDRHLVKPVDAGTLRALIRDLGPGPDGKHLLEAVAGSSSF